MSETNTLVFKISGKIANSDLKPGTISLALFSEFNGQVARFLKGKGRYELLEKNATVSVQDGSYRLNIGLSTSLLGPIENDIKRLAETQLVDGVDPIRAKVVQEWQESARKHPDREYFLAGSRDSSYVLRISKDSNFKSKSEDSWVSVEKYLYGIIVDAGGATASNIHLKTSDSEGILKIDASRQMLREETTNRLYHDALLRVVGRQNLRTGELQGLQLIEFADYQPRFDETAFKVFVEKGTKAWAGVENASRWVEDLRDGSEARD
jgi:hypothetical protein